MSMDATQAKPAATVRVTATADAGSYVGLLAVDQSVLLLKSGNDITADMVRGHVRTYEHTYSILVVHKPRVTCCLRRHGDSG